MAKLDPMHDQPRPLRQRKTKNPCQRCGLRKDLCLCVSVEKMNLKTRLSLVIHHRETLRTTNTGQLALLSLSNSEKIVRGLIDHPIDISRNLKDGYHPLLLYPSEDAVELTREFSEQLQRPVQLIVPDGNWRQASKVHYRHKELSGVQRVFVAKPDASMDQLRLESKLIGMPTLLAIALAFKILEGQEAYQNILDLLTLKIERTQTARGIKLAIHR